MKNYTIIVFVMLISTSFITAFNFPSSQDSVNVFQGNLTNLSQMADVNIPSPSDNQFFRYDSGTGKWVAESVALDDTNASTACSTSEVLLGNGTCLDSDTFYDYIDLNSSGLVIDWNATGYIMDWNSTGFIYDWNNTNLIINWSNVISAGDNSSWNETWADGKYIQNETIDGYIFQGDFKTISNGYNWSVDDDGSNIIMDFGLGGTNYLAFQTDGAFMQLYGNPGPANNYLMWTVTETQGADTVLNIYEGGTGHNRFWDSGSMRIGGGADALCSNLTSDVDCDTPATGADLVVQDDGWFGGKIFSSDWTNVSITESQISDFDSSNYYTSSQIDTFDYYNATNPQPGVNASWNETHADTLYATIDEPLWSGNSSSVARTGDCPSGQFVQNTTTGGVECLTPTLTESDPYWTANQSSYYNSTEVDTEIENANTSMKTYVDTQDSAQDECSEITGCVENAITNATMNKSVEWGDLLSVPTGFADGIDNDTGGDLTHLSNFTDDLSDRGYTHLSNFTDDLGHVEDNSSWNETYADGLYADISITGDNSSWNESYANGLYLPHTVDEDIIDNNLYNSTQFNEVGGVLNLVISELNNLIDSWFTGKTTDDLTEGSTNFYDNRSWNESHADTLYSTGDHTTDTNASTACNSFEVLLGNGTCHDSNNFYDDTDTSYNATYDAYNNTGLIQDWNRSGLIKDWDPNGYIKDWNSTGDIKDWDPNGYIKDWNATGYITDWNNTGLIINWSANGDYYTKSQIDTFDYYNLSDFDISDYYTSAQTDTEITNANTSMKTYVDAQDSAQDECSEITGCVENAVTNATMNKTVNCADIVGSPDSDFCTDDDSGGDGYNTTEEMQDAVGGAFNSTLIYDDGNDVMAVNQSWADDLFTTLTEVINAIGGYFDQDLNTTSDVTFDDITSTNNVTADYFIGNGSQLTGILTVDTNASTACTDFEVLLGNGTCHDSDNFYDFVDYNSTGLIKDWDPNGYIKNWNSTGYITNWNRSGDIKDWDPNGYIIDWNSTGYITDWNNTELIQDWNRSGLIKDWDSGTDTNASTACNAFEILLGNGTCHDGNNFFDFNDFDIADYYTSSQIDTFAYYNASDFSIADYYTSSQIDTFDYYNTSDFSISDYYTSSQIDTFDYYNASDFSISDYYTSSQIDTFNYYNTTNQQTEVDPLYDSDYSNIALTNISETFSENITVEGILLEKDTTNHKIYDNSTCVLIEGDTSTLIIC